MHSGEKAVVLFIADISGYTQFMVANRYELAHGQWIITELMQTIIKQVEIPLEVAKLEGDAVFLYAIKDADPTSWNQAKRRLGDQLLQFFEVFSNRVAELTLSRACHCGGCQNIEKLKLKLVVHSGTALFHQVGKFEELAGVDVITVHRLLKNSVTSSEYILFTEPAYLDLELPAQAAIVKGEEQLDVGVIRTCIYFPPGSDQAIAAYKSLKKSVDRGWNVRLIFESWLAMLGLKRRKPFHHLHEEPE